MRAATYLKTGFLGLQHVLAMYAGAVIVPLILGSALKMSGEELSFLIALDLFTSGIATLIQVIGGKHLGIRLPVILGCTFTAVPPMIAIGKVEGLPGIFGAVIISGLAVMLLATFFSKVLKWFPPVVTGSVIMIIGLSLIPVAMKNAAGGEGSPDFGQIENLLLAMITVVSVVAINRWSRGYIRAISVLLAVMIGTVVAFFMGKVDFGQVTEAGWFRLVEPLHFGMPTFQLPAILTMILVGIVSMIESTGVFLALGEVCERKLEPKDIRRGLRAEGLASVIGGLFSSFPYTSYSQNVGLVALSKVRKRRVAVAAGLILMALAFLPKVAAITMVVPTAVLGGAMLPMFGMVIASGVRMLHRVDFRRNENLLIVACSVGIGLGAAVVPGVFKEVPHSLKLFVENGIVVGSLTAFLLNLLFTYGADHKKDKDHSSSSVAHNQQVEVTL
ncbi:xanthine permease [Marininema mesophilum]|uniref:Xanthine permease n=1 Tax=Marininema mesophilum TaxID=1048340 RepID=A0A1H2QVU6_9BACL|nr:nucleobase:cation symporter-2 family protein [Marininema mesophilum]SDW10774.1 xanthine permease [Marininema mesophilum]